AAAPAPRLLHGARADVDRLKEALSPAAAKGRPRYLHLATHGFFDRTSREGQQLRPFAREEALPFGLAREYQTYTRNPLLLTGLRRAASVGCGGRAGPGQTPAPTGASCGPRRWPTWTCAAASWPCSAPARRAWARWPTPRACRACSGPFKQLGRARWW